MSSGKRNFVIAGIALLAVVYLLGYVPQYRRVSQLESELAQRTQRVEELERAVRLGRARDLASLMYLEVTKKNFGTAAESASALFNTIREAGSQTEDAALRSELDAIAAQRDAVVAGLAKADPSVEPTVREILERLFRATRSQ